MADAMKEEKKSKPPYVLMYSSNLNHFTGRIQGLVKVQNEQPYQSNKLETCFVSKRTFDSYFR